MGRNRTSLFSRHRPGGIFVIDDLAEHPGDIYFVDSGHASASDAVGFGNDPDSPFATIDFAIGQCTASQGDVIYVMPGHTETISGATSLVMDVIGVRVIGLGRGADRPTLTFSATDSEIAQSAASCSFENFLITCTGVIDVVVGITVSAADVQHRDIEIRDGGATSQFIDAIIVATGGARFRSENYRFLGAAGDAGASGISITGAVDGVEIIDPNIDGTLSAGCIENVTGVLTNIVIQDPILRNRHATQDGCVVMVATSTGNVVRGYGRTATHDADGFNLAVVFAAGQVFDFLVVNLDGERGGYWGTASTA